MPEKRTKKGWFDSDAFYSALDSVRQASELNWKQVGLELG